MQSVVLPFPLPLDTWFEINLNWLSFNLLRPRTGRSKIMFIRICNFWIRDRVVPVRGIRMAFILVEYQREGTSLFRNIRSTSALRILEIDVLAEPRVLFPLRVRHTIVMHYVSLFVHCCIERIGSNHIDEIAMTCQNNMPVLLGSFFDDSVGSVNHFVECFRPVVHWIRYHILIVLGLSVTSDVRVGGRRMRSFCWRIDHLVHITTLTPHALPLECFWKEVT